MAETDDKIAQLQTRLENLVKTQISFQQEISRIRYELNVLHELQQQQNSSPETPTKTPPREYVPPPRINQPPTDREANQQTTEPHESPHSDSSIGQHEP